MRYICQEAGGVFYGENGDHQEENRLEEGSGGGNRIRVTCL